MSKKDNMTKAELIAEIEKNEQLEEQRQNELEQAKAEAKAANDRADRIAAETEQTLKGSVSTAPATSQQPNAIPSEPQPSPDGKTHFHSRFRQYQVPGVKFFDHRFITDDNQTVEQLKKHPAYGSEFWISFAPGESKKAA